MRPLWHGHLQDSNVRKADVLDAFPGTELQRQWDERVPCKMVVIPPPIDGQARLKIGQPVSYKFSVIGESGLDLKITF